MHIMQILCILCKYYAYHGILCILCITFAYYVNIMHIRAREFDSLFTVLRAHDLATTKNHLKWQMFLFRAQVGRLGCARNKTLCRFDDFWASGPEMFFLVRRLTHWVVSFLGLVFSCARTKSELGPGQ